MNKSQFSRPLWITAMSVNRFFSTIPPRRLPRMYPEISSTRRSASSWFCRWLLWAQSATPSTSCSRRFNIRTISSLGATCISPNRPKWVSPARSRTTDNSSSTSSRVFPSFSCRSSMGLDWIWRTRSFSRTTSRRGVHLWYRQLTSSFPRRGASIFAIQTRLARRSMTGAQLIRGTSLETSSILVRQYFLRGCFF